MKRISKDVQLNLFVEEDVERASAALRLRVHPASSTLPVTAKHPSLFATAAPIHQTEGNPAGIPDCEWTAFMRANGRIPMLADERKPWEYRGWLLYYRLLCEDHLGIAPRWDYVARTRMAGRLLDEPIPQVRFENTAPRECYKMLEGWLRSIDRLQSQWSPMDTLLDWFLWGFGLREAAPKICEQLHEELYRSVNIGPWLLSPYDYLGEWTAAQKGNWNPHAFFPTPHSVVEMMVQMALSSVANDDESDMRSKEILDPALGSGRMLLHASNFSLRLFGVDIDPLMVKMSLVNGALYAPWMVRPFPDQYFSQMAGDKAHCISHEDALAVSP